MFFLVFVLFLDCFFNMPFVQNYNHTVRKFFFLSEFSVFSVFETIIPSYFLADLSAFASHLTQLSNFSLPLKGGGQGRGSSSLLVLFSQEVVDSLDRVECAEAHINEDSVPVAHCTVPESWKFESLEFLTVLAL